MTNRQKALLSLLPGALLAVPLYILLHEGGHALVAVLCGAKITAFRIFEAYVVHEGGRFTAFTHSLQLAAGTLLPAAAALVYTAFYRRSVKNVFYHVFSAVFCIASFVSPLSGVLISVLYLMGKAPANDDITKLIEAGGLSPWLVILFCAGAGCGVPVAAVAQGRAAKLLASYPGRLGQSC